MSTHLTPIAKMFAILINNESSQSQIGQMTIQPELNAVSTSLLPTQLSLAERLEVGKALRQTVPLTSHQEWHPSKTHRHPLDLLQESNQGRIPELIPLRYGRMLQSAFAFLRGSAIIMAADLANTPTTNIQVQACGDCHLLNFGGFATPERNLTFDLNDFDETLPAPWEWDVKRLAVSFMVAGWELSLPDNDAYAATKAAVQAYRLAMAEYGQMGTLAIWYARLDTDMLIEHAPDAETQQYWMQMATKAFSRSLDQAFLRLTEVVDQKRRFIDNPPQIYHVENYQAYLEEISVLFEQYRDTLQTDRQFLLDHYHLVDVAIKVVGVGSVGTHCGVALLMTSDNEPLLLQYKEARPSVLEPYTNKSPYPYQGQRVVCGQRLMQAASDIFLGWTSNQQGQDFYFRQLWDMKASIKFKGMSASGLTDYAEVCGSALARAHARTGDAAIIGSYLGSSDIFDKAVADFALSYGYQVKQDYQTLVDAVNASQIEVKIG